MYQIDEQKQKEIMAFIRLTRLDNFPDWNTPQDEFVNASYRFSDIIDAYGGCSKKAAQTYNEAVEKALAYISIHDAEEARKYYCEIMTREFYSAYIQYKWQQVKTYQQQTSVLSQALYSDYRAALDVHSYVDYSPLLCV